MVRVGLCSVVVGFFCVRGWLSRWLCMGVLFCWGLGCGLLGGIF